MPLGVQDASAASADQDATVTIFTCDATSALADVDALACSHDWDDPTFWQAKGPVNLRGTALNFKVPQMKIPQTPANRPLISPADLSTIMRTAHHQLHNHIPLMTEDSALTSPFVNVNIDLEAVALTLSSTDEHVGSSTFICLQQTQPMTGNTLDHSRTAKWIDIVWVAEAIRAKHELEDDIMGALELTFNTLQRDACFPSWVATIPPREDSSHMATQYKLNDKYADISFAPWI
jgi:hypothetical protein